MLIRSQDKKKITSDLCLEIVENEYTHTFEIFNNSVGIIGEYLTEEDAIDVLDMVCKAYKDFEDYKNHKNNRVFEMPKDDEC